MTINEAIYCMYSYMPENDEHCVGCKYYGCNQEDEQMFTCQSSKAHRMAIEALEQQRVAHWKMVKIRGIKMPVCSNCLRDNGTLYEYDYCPTCGAKMEVQE